VKIQGIAGFRAPAAAPMEDEPLRIAAMLNAVVVTPDASFAEGIQRLALASRKISVYRTFDRHPSIEEMDEACRTCDPDLLLVDVTNWKEAAPLVAQAQRNYPKTAIVGFGGGPARLREAEYEAAGIPVLLITPISLDEFQDGVLRAFRTARGRRHEKLTAFLPAKAGNGCSVTAFNTAGALARTLGRRVLLIESDFSSGILAVRAQVEGGAAVEEILDNPAALEAGLWKHHVLQAHGIDLLTAGGARRRTAPKWSNYYHLLRFAETTYDAVIADLGAAMADAGIEVVLRAARICLVCTPERPSLALAHRRWQELDGLGVDPDRILLVVNRWHSTDPPLAELAKQVACRHVTGLPNDYHSVRSATDAGRLVDEDSKLGAAYTSLAQILAGEQAPGTADAAPVHKSRFRLAAWLGR
jgi:MinD-like ATPase involved in chromosome partitioning or flagellar assembly